MPWGIIVGAGLTLWGQKKAEGRADSQFAMQKEMMDKELALKGEGLNFSKQQYADWKAKYDPVYASMMANIEEGIDPDYAAIAGDVKSGFESARGANRRQMLRYGIRPQDGHFLQSDRMSRLAESTAHVGTRNRARQASRGLRYARYADVHNSLRGIGTNLAANVQGAYNSAGNTAGIQAGMYNQMGVDAYNSGMANAAGWGNFIGNVDWGQAWGDVKGWFNRNQDPTGTAGIDYPTGG